MLVWSGWGILVPVFILIAFLVSTPVAGLVTSDTDLMMAISTIITGLLAGLATFLAARKLEEGQGRAFIDEATQQRIVVRRSAGSLFFVPTRYWAYIVPVVAVIVAVFSLTTPSTPAAADVGEAGPAVASQPG
ncbi:MAG: hypothetical protein ACOH1H_13050 [Brevundimonas sp.]|jgi:hypothetical protein